MSRRNTSTSEIEVERKNYGKLNFILVEYRVDLIVYSEASVLCREVWIILHYEVLIILYTCEIIITLISHFVLCREVVLGGGTVVGD